MVIFLSDSSTWDAIDFDAVDAAVISTSHVQQHQNRNVVVNQRGMRSMEQQVATLNEAKEFEKGTARVGHKFDGEPIEGS